MTEQETKVLLWNLMTETNDLLIKVEDVIVAAVVSKQDTVLRDLRKAYIGLQDAYNKLDALSVRKP